MVHKKKSWQEKLADKKGYPKILKLETRFPCYNAVHGMGADVGDEAFACSVVTKRAFVHVALGQTVFL